MERLTLEEWMEQEGYHSYNHIRENVFFEGGNESDVDAKMDSIQEKYEEYLEEMEDEEEDLSG